MFTLAVLFPMAMYWFSLDSFGKGFLGGRAEFLVKTTDKESKVNSNLVVERRSGPQIQEDLQCCTPVQASFSLPLHFLLGVFHTEKIQINWIFFFVPEKHWEKAKKAILSLKAFPREENFLESNFEKAKPTEKW